MAPFKPSSQYGICRLGVAVYVLREIWVSRCRATLDGTSMRARDICLKVMYRTQILTLVNKPKAPSLQQAIVLSTIGISREPIRKKKGRWCKWDKPSPGWFKVDVDGSEHGGNIT